MKISSENIFDDSKVTNKASIISDSHGLESRKEMETRYQGRWDAVIMADYCWNLKRDFPAAKHSRSSKKREFKP